MTREKKWRSGRTDWLSLVSLGLFILLLGVIWIIKPGLWSNAVDFFRDVHLENVTEHIILPAPEHSHPEVYTAAMQFCLVFGILQVGILAFRFVFRESVDRKTGTLSGIVFWLGAAFFLNMLAGEEITWFGFIAGLIISIGMMIVVSSLVKLLFKYR